MTEMRGLIFICLACFASFTGSGDVLWWTINDTAEVDGQSIYSFVTSYGVEQDETGYNWYNVGARVRMTNPDRSTDVIPVAFSDFPNERFDYLDFFDGGGANGGGFGTGTWMGQSILHESPIYSRELLEEAAFMVELGYLNYDDVLDVVGWETIATSETRFGSELREMIFPGGVNVPASSQWTPTHFRTIPEPSSALLCIIGFGMIMLRRKRLDGKAHKVHVQQRQED